jgi:hypothetical protein
VGSLEYSFPFYVCFFFWGVPVTVFIPVIPMFEFTVPDWLDYLARPLDLLKLVQWQFAWLIYQVLKLGCDESFQEVSPSDV